MDVQGYAQVSWDDASDSLVSDAVRTTRSTNKGPALRDELAKHMPELRARAMKLAKNPTLADDVLQETFERALRFEARYERGTNVRAWLYQILFSVFVTGYRKRKRETRCFTRLELESRGTTECNCDDAVASLTPGTARALEVLPAAFVDVLMLVDVCDQSYRDAAVQLNVPLGTVMSRLHRARKMAAEVLSASAA